MADLEERVSNLEKKISELELNINKSLNEIKVSLTEISTTLKNNASSGDLKNELIEKDVKSNSKRIDVLEGNQNKIIWVIVMAVIGLIGEAVIYYLQNKP
jgi:hypothetical protein